MGKAKRTSGKKRPPQKQQSVFKEAWDNMSGDLDRLMPEALRHKGKKKFVLWLLILELVILGLVGKFLYDWLFR